jgi:hypothetical protein
MAAKRIATLDVEREVSSEDLHALLDRVLDLHGCTACGLVGIDLRFRVPDDLEEELHPSKFEGLRGFRNIAVARAPQ